MTVTQAARAEEEARPLPPRGLDVAGFAWPVAIVAGLLAVTAVWGRDLVARGVNLAVGAPPLAGEWDVRIGPGLAVTLLAVAAVLPSVDVARRLSWRLLPWATAAAALVWSVGLALSDGPEGLRDPLTDPSEYLVEVPRVTDGFLPGFTERILTDEGAPSQWATHVGGHPPGALLLFAGLARIGLGGPWPAALLCVVVGASAAAAAVVAVRAVAGESTARAAAPFVAIAPGAVWLAVSADALFLGVTAWGVALLVLASTRGSDAAALGGGLLMGAALFLTYGVLPLGVLALTAVLLRRTTRPLVVAGAAVAAVVATFAVLGFWWLDGLTESLARVADGVGGQRPVGYFLVANIAGLLLAIGPSTLAGLRHLTRTDRLWWLVGPTLVALLLAEVSGKSKGETERIWLLFTPWLLVACARLPHPRVWLVLQVVTAVAVQLTLRSKW